MPALTVVVSPVHKEFEAETVPNPGGAVVIVIVMFKVVVELSGRISYKPGTDEIESVPVIAGRDLAEAPRKLDSVGLVSRED